MFNVADVLSSLFNILCLKKIKKKLTCRTVDN